MNTKGTATALYRTVRMFLWPRLKKMEKGVSFENSKNRVGNHHDCVYARQPTPTISFLDIKGAPRPLDTFLFFFSSYSPTICFYLHTLHSPQLPSFLSFFLLTTTTLPSPSSHSIHTPKTHTNVLIKGTVHGLPGHPPLLLHIHRPRRTRLNRPRS